MTPYLFFDTFINLHMFILLFFGDIIVVVLIRGNILSQAPIILGSSVLIRVQEIIDSLFEHPRPQWNIIFELNNLRGQGVDFVGLLLDDLGYCIWHSSYLQFDFLLLHFLDEFFGHEDFLLIENLFVFNHGWYHKLCISLLLSHLLQSPLDGSSFANENVLFDESLDLSHLLIFVFIFAHNRFYLIISNTLIPCQLSFLLTLLE